MIPYNIINYLATNETINSPVKGLDPKSDDRILSIIGSGDQIFAMLEFIEKGQIIATDHWQPQIDYLNYRIDRLLNGKIDEFSGKKIPYPFIIKGKEYAINGKKTNFDNIRRRLNYFENEKRIEKIKKNINNLKIIQTATKIQDFYDENYNKIFFSNAITYTKDIQKLLNKLPINGLIYFSESNNNKEINTENSRLILDQNLTNKARNIEKTWYKPTTYRKIK
ncbi:hypothetical protein K9L67_04105 [Candidatus Woesearchaeota archaeon]|nr:hypothetical protein [Candidatus Woesearchaeota archaeon]MCF7901385.1 hypothetical protein [Candidatus Woesearchaeota archaeon]MCF8013144.1 hypothetical protein [Candidatus Woesearchaeota archaeon]